jgi:hypothetical protein
MPHGPDPVSELSLLVTRSRQLMAELRNLEQRLDVVARRIAALPAPAHRIERSQRRSGSDSPDKASESEFPA